MVLILPWIELGSLSSSEQCNTVVGLGFKCHCIFSAATAETVSLTRNGNVGLGLGSDLGWVEAQTSTDSGSSLLDFGRIDFDKIVFKQLILKNCI